MGVSYTPVLAIGKQFDCSREAKEFYERFVNLTEEESEIIDDIGLDEFLYDKKTSLRCECMDLYSGDWYYMGYRLSPREVGTFAQQVRDAEAAWEAMFPGEAPEMIHAVRIA